MSHFIIGLSGGIGSGKTTIANMFEKLGIALVDADIVAREVVAPGTQALKRIVAHFSTDILTSEQSLDRKKLRALVFSNPVEKDWLNNLLHPLIRTEMFNQLAVATSPYVILVAPLLIENKLYQQVNRTLIIDVNVNTQIERATARDNSDRQTIENIIASQVSREVRIKHADDVISNETTDLKAIEKQVSKLHAKYLDIAINALN